jgi:hypothetical protein
VEFKLIPLQMDWIVKKYFGAVEDLAFMSEI